MAAREAIYQRWCPTRSARGSAAASRAAQPGRLEGRKRQEGRIPNWLAHTADVSVSKVVGLWLFCLCESAGLVAFVGAQYSRLCIEPGCYYSRMMLVSIALARFRGSRRNQLQNVLRRHRESRQSHNRRSPSNPTLERTRARQRRRPHREHRRLEQGC